MAASPPRCFLVNDRPVMIVETVDGGADCVVLDPRSGNFVVDRSWFSRTLPGDTNDVDSVTPAQMDEIVAWHRVELLGRMMRKVAALSDDDRRSLIDVLAIDPETPPLDADRVEIDGFDRLTIVGPRLVHRPELDAVLGPALTLPDPPFTVSYRAEEADAERWCQVDATFLDDACDGAAARLVVARRSPPAMMPSPAE